jgi:hypothetical protein
LVVALMVALMVLMMTSWLVSGLPRQFIEMKQNKRCSILFHFGPYRVWWTGS